MSRSHLLSTPVNSAQVNISDVPRAEKWSNSVLEITLDGKPVLHHLVLAAMEGRVFDKAKGSKKDLFAKVAANVNEKVLSKVVFKMRIQKTDQVRRPAKLTAATLEKIISEELARFDSQDTAEAKETGFFAFIAANVIAQLLIFCV